MKKVTPSAIVPVRKAKPAAEPTALTIAARLPKIKGKTPGERINFLHHLSVASGKLSIVAGILAGWELARVRSACDHGAWLAWLKANTSLSAQTARNYIAVYASTLGAARAALPDPVPLGTQPTNAELQAAAANANATSITGLYRQLQLLRRIANHGGAREGAGRKTTSALPKLSPDECRSEALHAIGPHLGALHDALARGGDADFLSLADLQDLETALRALVQRAADRIAAKLPSRS